MDTVAAADDHPVTGSTPSPGRRRFLIGAVAVTAAGGLGGAWALTRDDGRDDGSAGPGAVETGSGASSLESGDVPRPSGRWEHVPAAPLSPRHQAAVAWAGDRLVVWGGYTPADAARPGPPKELVDGATWTPADGWRPMADAPAAPAPFHAAIWDGTELVVAADPYASVPSILAYDPAADRWRDLGAEIPEVPAFGPGRQLALVDGGLVASVQAAAPRKDGHEHDIVLVDLDDGSVRSLDPGPFERTPYTDGSGTVDIVAVGDRVLATPNWDRRPWLLDPASGTWMHLDEPGPGSLHLLPAVAVGDAAAFQESSGASPRWLLHLEPKAEPRWSPIEANPHPPARWGYDPVWSGAELFVPGAAYDLAAGTWREVDPPPRGKDRQRSPQAMWTGDALLVFGGEEHSCPDNAECDRTPGPDTLDGWILRAT